MTRLENLDLSECDQIPSAELIKSLSNLTRLRSLNLMGSQIPEARLVKILPKWILLQKLEFTGQEQLLGLLDNSITQLERIFHT